MSQAVRYHAVGGPDVLRLDTIVLPPPAAGQARVRQTAIGFNFVDVMFRNGTIPTGALPADIGFEAIGVVEAVGDAANGIRIGDRVAYVNAGPGSYATARNVAAERLVLVPDFIGDDEAAAVIFKGLTAWYLVARTFPIKRDDIVLVHSAAGGVGGILCSWAKALGARVFGTVGRSDKIQTALNVGCEAAFVLGDQDIPSAITSLTGGRKAAVVYDAVGKDTFEVTLKSLDRFGYFVSYGAASGAPPHVEIEELNRRGCLFLTRPSIFPHVERREDLEAGAAAVFSAVEAGSVRPTIGGVYPLSNAAQLHADVEARRTTGSLILKP
jgi:NADPH:quinone reductase